MNCNRIFKQELLDKCPIKLRIIKEKVKNSVLILPHLLIRQDICIRHSKNKLMKFYYFILIVCLLGISSNTLQAQIGGGFGTPASTGSGVIEFEEMEFDFGKVHQGDTVRHIYRFKNTGTADLEILRVKTGCECTSSEWKPGPYKMGASGEIEIIFSTKDKSGPQQKGIVVETNGEKKVEIIRLTGEVILPESPGK